MSSNNDHLNRREADKGGNTLLIGRIVAASVIFALALIIKLSPFVSTLLLILAAAVAGYDIFIQAVSLVEEREFFAAPIVVVFVAVLSFVIGYSREGAALVILYQVGNLVIMYAVERTKQSAKELLRYSDETISSRVDEIASLPNAQQLSTAEVMEQSAGFILKIAMAFALIFAILVPIITNLTFKESIHRALAIILVSTPASVITAMPVTAFVGLCRNAQLGAVFNSASAIETASYTESVVIDKSGVLTPGVPQLLSVQSDVLDTDTFMMFAAHASCQSEQPFAKAITAAFKGEYRMDVISDFVDVPGSGVDLTIGGAHVTLATRELYISRGEAVPYETDDTGLVFYMMVSGRYVGRIVLSDSVFDEAENLAYELKNAGIERRVLVSEESSEDTEQLANELGFTNAYGELDTARKLQLISELSDKSNGKVMFVYSNGIEAHSAASVDVRVSDKGKYADALLNKDYISNLPVVLKTCRRVREVATENAVFAFALKAVLIFLSINGFCPIWFAVFMDMAASSATVLNSFRVTKNSLLDKAQKSE